MAGWLVNDPAHRVLSKGEHSFFNYYLKHLLMLVALLFKYYLFVLFIISLSVYCIYGYVNIPTWVFCQRPQGSTDVGIYLLLRGLNHPTWVFTCQGVNSPLDRPLPLRVPGAWPLLGALSHLRLEPSLVSCSEK